MQNIILNNEALQVQYFTGLSTVDIDARLKGDKYCNLLLAVAEQDLEQNRDLLLKILGAIGYASLDDVATLAFRQDEIMALASSEAMRQRRYLLSFGIAPTRMGFAIESEQRHFILESITVISAPSLTELSGNPAAKKDLWTLLKSTFKNS